MKLATAFDGTIQILRLEWTFLTFGFLMSFWSAFGQTFFISLFSPQLRNDLNLSHGELVEIVRNLREQKENLQSMLS